MRRHYFLGGMFWGLLLIILGVLYFLRNALNFDIPVGDIFFPILLILFVLGLIFRPHGHKTTNSVVFDEADISATTDEKEYSAVFGRASFDLTNLKPENKTIKVSAVFGSGIVKINSKIPVKIKSSGVFGAVHLPDGDSVAFGERTYTNKSYKEKSPFLYIEASAVFGNLEIIEG